VIEVRVDRATKRAVAVVASARGDPVIEVRVDRVVKRAVAIVASARDRRAPRPP
jgi:hypothetical protein